MAGFDMGTAVSSFHGIGLQACWFFSHQTELCGILRALPQLIDVHEQQVFGCSSYLQFTVQFLTPQDISIRVNHSLNPFEKSAGNQKRCSTIHDCYLEVLRSQRHQKGLPTDERLVISKSKNQMARFALHTLSDSVWQLSKKFRYLLAAYYSLRSS
jgi:hypothetical protein